MTKKAPPKPDLPASDEDRLFERAMRAVRRRLADPGPDPVSQDAGPAPVRKRPASGTRPPPAEPVPAPAAAAGTGLDRRTAERLRRGKLPIDARLDLHGLTQAEAHGRLRRFIEDSHHRGRRCVLVITGKGRRGDEAAGGGFMPDRSRGVLRRQVPLWLRGAGLSDKVVDLVPARPEHGGDGALYVYLRRLREPRS